MFDGINFKTIWGSLLHSFWSSNKIHIIWCGGILIIMLILAILHRKWCDGYSKKVILWRILCLLPLAAIAAHYKLYLEGCPKEVLFGFTSMYLIGLFALIPIPFANRETGYRVAAFFTGFLSILSAVFFAPSSPQVYNFSKQSYSESFTSLVKTMDSTYVLKDWKDVDFSELEKKYMPLVKEAETKKDPDMYYDVLTQFCNELHDGHVGVSYPQKDTKIRDFGLGLVKLDSGEVIAVCTSEEANEAGIQDGTVITQWDGRPILEAAAEDVPDDGQPVKENADMLSVIKLTKLGGTTVDVTYIDDEGEEKTVKLYDLINSPEDLKEQHSYKDTLTLFSHNYVIEGEETLKNFDTKMLDDKCGYIMISAEETDNAFYDIFGYLNADHKWARDMFRDKLKDLKSRGMEYLVIDLRNNEGGLDEIGFALVDLLTEEPQFGLNVGMRKGKEYKPLSDHGIKGDGEFADLKVIALTNYNCGSAGDSLSLALSELPNVTLAGITDPCGCNQETGGTVYMSGSDIVVYYPTGLVLNEKDEPNIDTKADRISRDPVEERIPLDKDAAMKIFHNREDYELDWAVNRLEGK